MRITEHSRFAALRLNELTPHVRQAGQPSHVTGDEYEMEVKREKLNRPMGKRPVP